MVYIYWTFASERPLLIQRKVGLNRFYLVLSPEQGAEYYWSFWLLSLLLFGFAVHLTVHCAVAPYYIQLSPGDQRVETETLIIIRDLWTLLYWYTALHGGRPLVLYWAVCFVESQRLYSALSVGFKGSLCFIFKGSLCFICTDQLLIFW